MALLTILTYPDPRLHTVAKPVALVDDRIRQLISALLPFDIDSAEFLEQAIGGFQRNRESAERLDARAK
jgi:peptide deformylase